MLPILLAVCAIGVWIAWTHAHGAPWLPASTRSIDRMLDFAEVSDDDVVFDLGCGDGRIVIAAARDRGARGVGIEVDPLRYLWARARVALARLGDRVTIVRGDFFKHDLSRATLVACYLLEATNEALLGKLQRELAPGTRVVSKSFAFPGLELVREDPEGKLYLYRI